jgi:4-amino-4-deoxy-L-arabinose transferase-like glycosyltransferase
LKIKHLHLLILLVIAYTGIASFYAVSTPLYEVNDELWHYPMVRYLAENGLALPPQDPYAQTEWMQQGSQPPLYYLIGAFLTSGINTDDLEIVRRPNPHADLGLVTPDNNKNVVIHNWEREAFPWSGTALATYITRFFSVALSILTIIVSYYTARVIFPQEPALAFGVAGVNTFLPMFLYISGAVNNDNLSNLTGNLLILILILTLKNWRSIDNRYYVAIGVITGAGILSKLSIGFAIPIVAITLLIISMRQKNWRPLILGGIISGALTILIAGWWYWRNYQLYDDPTGLNRFLEIVGKRAVPADITQLWSERDSFLRSFWGLFGWMGLPLPDWIYIALNTFGGIGLISSIIYFGRQIIQRRWNQDQWLPVILTLVWIAITFISYLQWTSTTPASQGRLIFVALSSILLWMVWGYLWFIPRRYQAPMVSLIIGCFAILAVYSQLSVIKPTYAPPQPAIPDENAYQATFTAQNSLDSISVYQADILTPTVYPTEHVIFDVVMQTIGTIQNNWSLYIHLESPDGVIVAQRNIYPNTRTGAFYLTELAPDFAWENFIAVHVPYTVYTPMLLDVVIGFYDRLTGERMLTSDGQDYLQLGQVELLPVPNQADIPNYINVKFENGITLLGYTLNTLAPRPNDIIELTLYWQTQSEIKEDWVVFANILDPQTLTKYADSNAMPASWTRPTSTWGTGEIIIDTHQLTIYPDAVSGIYELEVGMYIQNPDGTFRNLTVRNTNNKFTYLSRVRIQPLE